MNLKTIALILLVVGGAAHLAPGLLAPIIGIGSGYFTVQRAVGLLSVLLAVVLFTKKECK